jgi:tetratricopeptide (TPR) repeat protein
LRAWIVAGVVAGLGIIGAGISGALTDRLKGWTSTLLGKAETYICEFHSPQKPADSNQLVVLFPRLGDDPKDEAWRGIIKILYDETDFDTVPSCMRFETTAGPSVNTARTRFLRGMESQITAIRADMLLFGMALSPDKVKVWTANSLGGCEFEKSEVLDLHDPKVSQALVFKVMRSKLIRMIAEGLIAACNREPTDDWQGVARVIDIVAPYVEKRKSELDDADYYDVQFHLFALSFSHYANVGESPWFDRAKRAADALIAHAKDSYGAAPFQSYLVKLQYWKFRNTNSREALKQAVYYIRALQRNDEQSSEILYSIGDDTVVSALEAALSIGLDDVTAAEVEQVRLASSDYAIGKYSRQIEQDSNDAEAYEQRGSAHLARHDPDRAIDDFNTAIKLDPNNAAYFNGRCWARAVAGRDLALALDDCNESLRLKPNDGSVLNSRALVQFKNGAFDRAIVDYGMAIKQRPKDAASLYGRGVAKLKSGDVAGGNIDISDAKRMQTEIDIISAGYGVK